MRPVCFNALNFGFSICFLNYASDCIGGLVIGHFRLFLPMENSSLRSTGILQTPLVHQRRVPQHLQWPRITSQSHLL